MHQSPKSGQSSLYCLPSSHHGSYDSVVTCTNAKCWLAKNKHGLGSWCKSVHTNATGISAMQCNRTLSILVVAWDATDADLSTLWRFLAMRHRIPSSHRGSQQSVVSWRPAMDERATKTGIGPWWTRMAAFCWKCCTKNFLEFLIVQITLIFMGRALWTGQPSSVVTPACHQLFWHIGGINLCAKYQFWWPYSWPYAWIARCPI